MRAWLVLSCPLVCASLLSPAPTHAQPPLVVVERGAPEARVRAWEARAPDAAPLADVVRARMPVGTVAPERLAVLVEVERALAAARAAAARLDERGALTTLASASELARDHLDVPGMAAWYAEVELALALVAAQAGLDGLSDAALRRAASVDPGRAVLAAEARPEVVARARAIHRAIATAPRGRFAVRAAAPGAVVFVDDRRLGALPRVVEAPVGPHVVRVEAPGHASWARLIGVLEGDRRPLEVRLSPSRGLAAAEEAARAARAGELAAVRASLGALGPDAELFLLFPSRAHDRGLLVGCDAARCASARVEGALPSALSVGALGTEPVPRSLAWLERGDAPPVAPDDLAWWERWEIWAGVAGVVVAGVAAAVVAAQPSGPTPLVVVFDPSDVD